MEFSVRCPSPPNTYSYVREESSGSTRKSQIIDTRNLKIVVPPAHAQRVCLFGCLFVYEFSHPFEHPVEAGTSFYVRILAQKATRLGRLLDPGW